MPLRKKPSPRQLGIMEFVRRFVAENSLPPTVRDIQTACGISSTSVVDYNLRLLQRDGYLNRRPDVARGIELLDEEGRPTSGIRPIPIVGYIAAGQPLPDVSSDTWGSDAPLGTIELPPTMVRSSSSIFALKVKGMSMIDAFIDDGDVVLVEPVQHVEDGQMVVAWLKLEQEATLKKLYHEGERIRLQPANSQMEPIYSHTANVEVQGRVAGVIRIM
jgi:repressor LexA